MKKIRIRDFRKGEEKGFSTSPTKSEDYAISDVDD